MFGHETDTGSQNVHSYTYINDPGGVGQKSWAFSQSGSNIGLAILYHGTDLSAGAVKVENDYTWTQDAAGNNYIGSIVNKLDPGTAYAVSTTTSQTIDTHGNVTQVVKGNYACLSPASHTYNYTYLNSSSYTNQYIFNRLTSATVTDGTNNVTLASVAYDQNCGFTVCVGTGHSPTPREWDSNYTANAYRGNPTNVSTPSGATTNVYDMYGNVSSTTANGVTTTVSTTSATNYAAPSQITVGSSLTTSLSYSNDFLGLTNETGPNGTSVDIGYDTNARPTSSTSPFGATTGTSYNDTASPPNTCTMVNGRWTQTNLDGLGLPILTITGYGSSCGSGTFLSQAETTYGSCGCSPLGKMMSQAVPHTYGSSPAATTTYTYDGVGRTLSKATVGSDTQGTSTYVYLGNTVTAYDPAGKWKTFATDGFGNLIQVTEPNPAGGTLLTSYAYGLLGHLKTVTMPRSTGTQTRSFSYSGNFLMSATNPENGTVTYTYNGFGKVDKRTDAKGQVTAYTYDPYARLSEVQRYPLGLSGAEDTCQRETYYYDGSTPNGSTYPQNAVGHLSAVQYMGGHDPSNPSVPCDTTFTELYNYGTPGAPVGKELLVTRTLQQSGVGWSPYTATLAATFSYDSEGRINQETYPTDNSGANANLSYTFDSMGRLNTMTDNVAMQQLIQGATYGPANELTAITGGSYFGAWAGESRGYNSLKQLTGITSGSVGVSYAYPATGNNGKISSQTDAVSGETVAYTYDALNRLATAATQPSFSTPWGQSFTYDGFGNLTNVAVTQGSAPTFTATYDANNHAGGEDANGNPGYVPLPAYGTSAPATYDVENRLIGINAGVSSAVMFYSYAPGNKRVWRGNWTYSAGDWTRNTDEVTFWGVTGQKLGAYSLTTISGLPTTPQFYATQVETNYYFGSKLIKNANGWVYTDRLASVGKFYPYGQERPSATTNGTEKFTGYLRDAETGNDYAVNRYQSPGTGRFLTPDRGGHPKPTDPGSWNKYAYVEGDPVNFIDPGGTDECEVANVDDCYCAIYGNSDPHCNVFYNPICPGGVCTQPGVAGDDGPIPEEGRLGSTNPALNDPAAANPIATEAWALVGYALALQALTQNPDCSAFIGIPPVGGPSPATLLSEIWNGTTENASITYGYIPDDNSNGKISWLNAETGGEGPCQVAGGVPSGGCSSAIIELNTNASTPDNYAPTAQAWAVTLLHELGHVYEYLYGQNNTSIQFDGPGSPAGTSEMNTANVLSLCFP